jgi:hypothetical protein
MYLVMIVVLMVICPLVSIGEQILGSKNPDSMAIVCKLGHLGWLWRPAVLVAMESEAE